MKYLEFSKTKCQAPPAGYIFHGEDIYFLSEGIKKATAIANVENPQLNIDRVEDASSFFFALESMPFLSQRRLVIFQYPDISDKTFVKNLKAYLKNPNPTSIFVITTDKTQKTAYDCEMIDCSKESESVLSRWVVAKSKQSKKTISEALARDVVARCRCDMSKISKETEKLTLYASGEEITNADVEDCCKREVEKVVFHLTDAIAEKNGKKVRELLLEMKSDMTIFQIQVLLLRMFQRMFFIRTSGKTSLEIANALGVNGYAIKVLSSKAEKFSKLKLKNAVEYLSSVDYKIKSGRTSQDGAMEDMILFLMK